MSPPSRPLRTLVLGGYGHFGTRIVRALAGDAAIEVVVGGRRADAAAALATPLGARALAVDAADPGLADLLRGAGIGLVIHTAGPFQGQSYAVAEAAAHAGAHYVDLADGRRFVADFAAALDAPFRAAGRCAISGASTLPALSSAVVDALTRGWARIDSIDTCIAPAQTAPRGRATIEGVLASCGAPISVWDGGAWVERRGWARPERIGFARLRPRLGALCDVPDLELFPARYRVTRRVMFRAALEIGLQQRALAALAALGARGLAPQPSSLAGLLETGAGFFDRFGSATGGMVVRIEGVDADGRPRRRAWHVTAPDDHGPEIPCMAAILLARRFAHDPAHDPARAPANGAHACCGLLALADFEPEFARWGMLTDIVDEDGADRHGAPAL